MFEQLLMQAGIGASSATLMSDVAMLVVAIGGIISGIAGFMKAGKAKDFATSAGQVAQMYGQKAVEAKDRVKGVIEALYELAPEDKKKVIDQFAPKLDKISTEVRVGTEQVNKIDALFPEFDAAKLDVTRENFKTKPIV